MLFNTDAGRGYLADRKAIGTDLVDVARALRVLEHCNVLAAIKTAKLLDLGPDDAIITVATDGGAMYPSERAKTLAARFGGEFTAVDAAEVFGEHLADVTTERHDRVHRGRTATDLQPRLLHLGRAAGHAVRPVRSSAAARSSGAGCAATSACGTR